MNKKISTIILGICCCTSVLTTGCIEETFPTSGVLEEQLNENAKKPEALLWAMPAYFKQIGVISTDYPFDWGYGSIMHIRDVMTGDMAVVSNSYDHYATWEQNINQGKNLVYCQYFWNYYWKFVLTANKVISGIDEQTATDERLGYLGAAYAFRAFLYLDLARMYEFLPTDKTGPANEYGVEVKGLTVPIVKEGMTEEEARNNPRATREKMADFILSDLNEAEKYISKLPYTDKTLPHLDAVYGLKARYYMWLAGEGEKPNYYVQAKEYARKAIDESGLTPMTENDCLNPETGCNDLSKWMWGAQYISEDQGIVSGGLYTWTSWASNETRWGYSGAGPSIMISSDMYDRISDDDFRKRWWKAPRGGKLSGREEYADASIGSSLPEYASLKFRPAGGDVNTYTGGGVTAVPVMRVEEMYFIEMEAAAHQNSAEGLRLLKEFMTNYRQSNFVSAATGEALIDEIVFQKRVEFWGEGQAFFDIKRLNLPVTRGYAGTNFSDATRFNTEGRPAWMNLVIVQIEENNNHAVMGYNNPDPSGKYELWTEKGDETEEDK